MMLSRPGILCLGPPGTFYGKHTLHNVILILSAESLISHERSRAKGGATSGFGAQMG